MPVIDDSGRLHGIVTEVVLLDHLLSAGHDHTAEETIENLVDPNVPVVQPNTPLETLMDIFGGNSVALIAVGDTVQGILTKIDILDFMSAQVK